MGENHTVTILQPSSHDGLDVSEDLLNDTNFYEDYEKPFEEVGRMIVITTFPIIIILGTIGNLLTFIVMQRGSLKDSSTCFYMAILALADTGERKH